MNKSFMIIMYCALIFYFFFTFNSRMKWRTAEFLGSGFELLIKAVHKKSEEMEAMADNTETYLESVERLFPFLAVRIEIQNLFRKRICNLGQIGRYSLLHKLYPKLLMVIQILIYLASI